MCRNHLDRWLLERLRALVVHARANGPFYARHLSGVDPASIRSLNDFSRLPAISSDDLRSHGERMLCVSQDDVARVVTLQSSGTTGEPKRVFHTGDDLEATTDFFDWGMRNMVEPGQAVFVLLPGERPGGVGRLLGEALSRSGVRDVACGVLEDARATVERIRAQRADCLVGPPAHINLLAREWERRELPKGEIKSVLLCWDSVPDAVRRNAERAFGCRVFRHWGMIETGLGGAVECSPGSGMHLRETDVYLEIVDPETGRLVPDGEFGEMVVTTPLKYGMPLIRYRTGDRGRIMPGACACGSPLRRLDSRVRRLRSGVDAGGGALRIGDLSDALYGVPGLGDFSARLHGRTLHMLVCGDHGAGERANDALASLPVVRRALDQGDLHIEITTRNDAVPAVPGLAKRRIETDRESKT